MQYWPYVCLHASQTSDTMHTLHNLHALDALDALDALLALYALCSIALRCIAFVLHSCIACMLFMICIGTRLWLVETIMHILYRASPGHVVNPVNLIAIIEHREQ